jgi:formylglycine-generating enzyme required for sulfatase activity
MTDIFISYSRKDRSRVESLANALEAHGWSVFWDRTIPAGKTWREVIGEALENANSVIAVWSKTSVKSRWVQEEADRGLERNILIPILIDNVRPPLGFRSIQAVDLISWESKQSHSGFEKLITDISAILSPSSIESEEAERNLKEMKAKINTDMPEPGKVISPEPHSTQKVITNSIGMEFVRIHVGTFLMGSHPSEKDRQEDEIQHKVTISKPLYLQTTQVTQSQWKILMGDSRSLPFEDRCDTCPVRGVSWHNAQQFIENLNQKEKTDKYRLPTESEWEYVCRAGSTARFCYGDNEDQLGDYAWYGWSPVSDVPFPVAKKKPNAWGLYDMHGNVWEWCQDLYGKYPSGDFTDPKGASKYRVLRRAFGKYALRGGSWCDDAHRARSADRYWSNWDWPEYDQPGFGFRVARAP